MVVGRSLSCLSPTVDQAPSLRTHWELARSGDGTEVGPKGGCFLLCPVQNLLQLRPDVWVWLLGYLTPGCPQAK